MAAILHSLFYLSLLLSPALCRKISPPATGPTAALDVVAALSKATLAVSLDSRQILDQEEIKISGDGEISLRLHSRDFHPSSASHKDYRSLTLSRLQRDSDRVRAISARASLAVDGVKRSDLHPSGEEELAAAAADGIQGQVVSGTSQGSGEYFSRVGIGSPPKPLYMVLDTGSDVTWIQCDPCSDCYQQTDPVFDPSASATYSPLLCNSQICNALEVHACRNASCVYQVNYGDGSFTVGDFATETLTFGDSPPVTGVALGCGHDNEGLFVGSAGLLGLGGGSLSFPSQISARSFSYCLVDRDSSSMSSLTFGSGSESGSSIAAPMLKNHRLETFYYVGMTGISVGGEMLSIPPSTFAVDETGAGGVIVDSGTAVTRLQADAYAALKAAFRAGTTGLPAAGDVAIFDTCYDLSSRSSVEVPAVGLHFGGKELRLPAKNYLIPVDSTGIFCLAFAPTSAALSIIGNVQQQGTRVSFDLENSVVGFTLNEC